MRGDAAFSSKSHDNVRSNSPDPLGEIGHDFVKVLLGKFGVRVVEHLAVADP